MRLQILALKLPKQLLVMASFINYVDSRLKCEIRQFVI